MAARKYPLDPLAKLREQHVDAATRELAAAVRARETAEQRTRLAEREKATAEEKARAVRQAERAKLDGGELTAADLQRADAWGVAVAEENKRLEERVARAAATESAARTGEAEQRATVATRKADAEVVEKDRAKWTEQARKEALGREEEEAEEAWRPKH
jgi:YscO-like protein